MKKVLVSIKISNVDQVIRYIHDNLSDFSSDDDECDEEYTT